VPGQAVASAKGRQPAAIDFSGIAVPVDVLPGHPYDETGVALAQ
jgi:hypothetical protein